MFNLKMNLSIFVSSFKFVTSNFSLVVSLANWIYPEISSFNLTQQTIQRITSKKDLHEYEWMLYEYFDNGIKNGIDIHGDNDLGLRLASSLGFTRLVKLFLDDKADVHTNDDEPLQNACIHGHYEIVKILLEHGANVHANKDESLQNACIYGHYEIVKILLEHGADAHANDNMPITSAYLFGFSKIVELLIEYGTTA